MSLFNMSLTAAVVSRQQAVSNMQHQSKDNRIMVLMVPDNKRATIQPIQAYSEYTGAKPLTGPVIRQDYCGI